MKQPYTPTLAGLVGDAASAAGGMLGGAARQLTKVRRSRKPLHPAGDVVTGTLTRTGSALSGVPWLDSTGTDEVVVRLSRAVGLPHAVPDIHGLAIKVPTAGGHADLLLASTGLGRVTRFVLTAGRHLTDRPLTTLLPYRSPGGPLLIAARPLSGAAAEEAGAALRFELLWSHKLGPWVPFAELTVGSSAGPDPALSFDPVANPLPGLQTYDWIRRLRAPAYRAARDESGRA